MEIYSTGVKILQKVLGGVTFFDLHCRTNVIIFIVVVVVTCYVCSSNTHKTKSTKIIQQYTKLQKLQSGSKPVQIYCLIRRAVKVVIFIRHNGREQSKRVMKKVNN